ncbi:MAG: chorismate synthase [Bacteroidales bacterium]|nr:chorismate synthase [Bacteroidales bacterium]
MNNTFGDKYRITVFGTSHSPELGVVIDGLPAGLEIAVADFEKDLLRRRSGAKGTTARREEDVPEIRRGLDARGFTTGEALEIVFKNGDTRPGDYSSFNSVPRPGHADYTSRIKYGKAEPGGGIFSGRMTLPLVAAGAVAKKLTGIAPKAEIVELGGLKDGWDAAIERAMEEGDSLGAVVECRTEGLPVGLGEPFFDGLESLIAHAVFSIPGVRGIEFGDGFRAAAMKGSDHNDPFGPDGVPAKNGAGGVNGGLSNGAPLVFRVAFKPTSSIAKEQQSWDFEEKKMVTLSCPGRHDTCFALRTPVIVEAVTAIVLSNLL